MKKLLTKRLLLLVAVTALMVLAVGVGCASAEPVTWNPNDKVGSLTLTNDNLTATSTSLSARVRANKYVSSGKWYWEVKAKSLANGAIVGVAPTGTLSSYNNIWGYSCQGVKTNPKSGYGNRYYANDVVGIKLDLDNGTLEFLNNNVSQGIAYTGLQSRELAPVYWDASSANTDSVTANFGATPFAYPVPEGYQPYDSEDLLAAPTNLIATPGDTQVSLSWTAITGATSYTIKRSETAGGPYTEIATDITTASYTDAGLTNGTIYYYVVTAVGTSGESGDSNEASATPQAALPNAPTGLTATGGNEQVSLSWTAVDGATSYIVKRATAAGGGYTDLASGITTTSYTDSTVTNGTTYYYIVTAVNAGGESGNSNEASATPQETVIPPSGNGTLIITVANNADREYNLTMEEIQDFMAWYANRSTGGSIYIIDMGASGAYSNMKDYLVFDKIVAWKVMEY